MRQSIVHTHDNNNNNNNNIDNNNNNVGGRTYLLEGVEALAPDEAGLRAVRVAHGVPVRPALLKARSVDN